MIGPIVKWFKSLVHIRPDYTPGLGISNPAHMSDFEVFEHIYHELHNVFSNVEYYYPSMTDVDKGVVFHHVIRQFEKSYKGLSITAKENSHGIIKAKIVYGEHHAQFKLEYDVLDEQLDFPEMTRDELDQDTIDIPAHLLDKVHVMAHSFYAYPDSDLAKTVNKLLIEHKEKKKHG